MPTRQIRDLILRHAPHHGTADTPIEGLELFRVTTPIPTMPTVYPASLCLLVQGHKRLYLGGETKTYGDGSFLCCTMPLPVRAEVPEASARSPALGLLLSLETLAMTETLVAAETSEFEPEPVATDCGPGLVVAPWDDRLLESVARLLELLEDPAARQVLVASRLRELYFALLRSRAGGALRRTFGDARDLSRALAHVHEHLAEPITVDELARIARMSRAVFHRRFKAATTLSPLQFIKAIRLNQAASHLARGMHIGEAAERVGYGSPSQFSREFRRHYGVPPRQWAATTGPHEDPPST